MQLNNDLNEDVSKNPFSIENLARIKENISTSYDYNEDNCKRFRKFRNYIFRETVSEDQRSMLNELGRPSCEFNILEAYLSRQAGEFAKHEPSITVSPAEDSPLPPQLIKFLENNIRHAIYEANKDSFSSEIFQETNSGGFSIGKVWNEFKNPMSMDQVIKWGKTFDSTLCGFDPLARTSHKGDGGYSFEIFPMLEEDFKMKNPKIDIRDIEYLRDIEGFSWSYEDSFQRKTILVCDYYEKKKKKVKIVKLANGNTMPLSEYNKLKKMWEEENILEQIPIIVNQRMTELEKVVHYTLIGCKILSYTETDYTYLPHVFFDGNSKILSHNDTSSQSYQMTRPSLYHAMGVQDLKNFAGQSLANSLQNQVQHKFIVMNEAIPQEKDYLDAITDPQKASTLVVNAFYQNNPDQPIPNPIREVQNVPCPPEVMQAFQITDPTTQTILGSYASNLGKNDNDLSGKAIIESGSAGNAVNMPYIMGYLAGLNQMAIIHIDLLPKYILGKRKLPIMNNAGDKGYQEVIGKNYNSKDINPEEAIKLDYGNHALNVCIEAGVNFQVQKNQAMQQITALMSASEEFAAFMNDDESLPILVDNLTIYGSDRLKEAVPKWIEKKKQMQQQAMQMQQQQAQMDPRMLKAQADIQKVKLQEQQMQLDQAQNEVENQLAIAKLANEKILNDSKVMESEAKISQAQIDSSVRLEEAQTSLERHALDSAAKMAEVKSREHSDHLAEQKHIHERSMDIHGAGLKHAELIHKIEHENKTDKEKKDVESKV